MLLDAAAAAAALSVEHVAHLLIFSGVASSFAPFGCSRRPLSTPLYLSLPPPVTFLLIFLCPTFLALFSSSLSCACLIFLSFFSLPFLFFCLLFFLSFVLFYFILFFCCCEYCFCFRFVIIIVLFLFFHLSFVLVFSASLSPSLFCSLSFLSFWFRHQSFTGYDAENQRNRELLIISTFAFRYFYPPNASIIDVSGADVTSAAAAAAVTPSLRY